jgi:hypothetical protein
MIIPSPTVRNGTVYEDNGRTVTLILIGKLDITNLYVVHALDLNLR